MLQDTEEEEDSESEYDTDDNKSDTKESKKKETQAKKKPKGGKQKRNPPASRKTKNNAEQEMSQQATLKKIKIEKPEAAPTKGGSEKETFIISLVDEFPDPKVSNKTVLREVLRTNFCFSIQDLTEPYFLFY